MPITITMGAKVAQVVAVNVVSQVEVALGTLEKLDEMQGIKWTKMSDECRKGGALSATRFILAGGVV